MVVNNINWVPFIDTCEFTPNKTFSVKVLEWCWYSDRVLTFVEDQNVIDTCAEVVACVNEQLALPDAWSLTNFKEAVQDAVWESLEWFDYNDALNQWLMENPFPIKYTVQWTTWAATLNPDDIINITIDNTVTDVTVDETVPTLINVKIPSVSPYVKDVANPVANTWTAIVHNLNTPVPSLYAYDWSNEYIDIERKYVDTNTVEYRTTTTSPFTYYIKS